ncbi:hypothetical protein TNCV_4395921 [Trichonephila clavipes]|uniref:Uncharacterized protein n=1 Tax=Trichonephila clavipes TaxID=2585209 RepID=A0A8X6W4W3_TRICX|nr:hypothetical protein TNCV_4395921 [Trichonephila clavipes]
MSQWISGNNALPYRTIARWEGKLQQGRVSTTDEQRSAAIADADSIQRFPHRRGDSSILRLGILIESGVWRVIDHGALISEERHNVGCGGYTMADIIISLNSRNLVVSTYRAAYTAMYRPARRTNRPYASPTLATHRVPLKTSLSEETCGRSSLVVRVRNSWLAVSSPDATEDPSYRGRE